MATLTKFNSFSQKLGEGVFNFSTHQLKVALTNTEPSASDSVYTDIISPLSSSQFSGTNPFNLSTISFSQISGVAKLILDDLTLTASTTTNQFRYIVVYSDTATNKDLIGYYDYGSSITLNTNDTFKLDFDGSNGVITIS